jgi:serine/threonine protein kinase
VILHRDVKPANVLLDAHLNARLADPGMALVSHVLGSGGLTHVSTLQVVGTNGCLDPAVQATGRYDQSSDGYSLGVTLLVVLTGWLPFDDTQEEPLITTRLHNVLNGSGDVTQFADAAAGWPTAVAQSLIQICKGLLHPVRRLDILKNQRFS